MRDAMRMRIGYGDDDAGADAGCTGKIATQVRCADGYARTACLQPGGAKQNMDLRSCYVDAHMLAHVGDSLHTLPLSASVGRATCLLPRHTSCTLAPALFCRRRQSAPDTDSMHNA